MKQIVRSCLRLCGLMVLLSSWADAFGQEKTFDHAETGFELTGGHNFVACESCHSGGQFAGTPTECVACHSVNGRINATAKPVNHIHTSERCDTCHNTQDWQAVPRVDHHEVFGLCSNCHNNVIAPGKPVDHIPVQSECSDCHSDLAWQPVQFSHDRVTGPCVNCHNGTSATGRPVDHINVNPVCEACHNTVAFSPVGVVDHDYVVGTCASCHDGMTALGRPSDHILVNPVCEACHTNTTSFAPVAAADVDHNQVIGACFSCHNNQVAPGQPPTHIPVREPLCHRCHSTEVWNPPVTIDLDLLVF